MKHDNMKPAPPTNPDVIIGLDLGDRHSYWHRLAVGEPDQHGRVATTKKGLGKLFTEHPDATVVMEAGCQSAWIAELAAERGVRPVVANPRRLRLIYAGRAKSDQLDAEALARLARAEPKLLYPVQPKGAEARAALAVVHARAQLVEERTGLINSARGLSKSSGARLPKCASEAFPRRVAADVPEALRPALAPLLAVIASMNQGIAQCDREIGRLATEVFPAAERLATIPGVGLLTALSFVLVIGDPKRFADPRDVGAFLGLTPRRSQSGGRDPQRGITKAGDPYLRSLLTQCAQHTLGPFGADTELRRWGLALVARGGAGAKKKAVTAVARRLSVLMHRVWLDPSGYQPERMRPKAA